MWVLQHCNICGGTCSCWSSSAMTLKVKIVWWFVPQILPILFFKLLLFWMMITVRFSWFDSNLDPNPISIFKYVEDNLASNLFYRYNLKLLSFFGWFWMNFTLVSFPTFFKLNNISIFYIWYWDLEILFLSYIWAGIQYICDIYLNVSRVASKFLMTRMIRR